MAKDILHTFEWSEFLDAAEQRGREGESARAADGRHGRTEWDAGADWSKAQKMGRSEGYAQAMAQVDAVSGAVEKQVETTFTHNTFAAAYDVAGAEVDMGRYLSGVPECMVQSEPIKIARKGRAVRVLVSVAINCNISADTVLRRGAAVIALCDILQKAQHPLEVWLGITVESGQRSHTQLVCVQHANEPLDEGRICYALAHPTVHRRLGFAVQEGESDTVRREFGFGGGAYGRARSTPGDVLPDQPGNTIVLPALETRADWTVAGSVKWIQQELSKIFDSEG